MNKTLSTPLHPVATMAARHRGHRPSGEPWGLSRVPTPAQSGSDGTEDSMSANRPKSGDEVRAAYLRFFQDRDHLLVPSASLIPARDPTRNRPSGQ